MLQSSPVMPSSTRARDDRQLSGIAQRCGDASLRTILSGLGGTLIEAFENLKRAEPSGEDVQRHSKRNIVGYRIPLTPEEGNGYWKLMRIRNDLYVIAQDFSCKQVRRELIGSNGLLQFNFQLSGDLTIEVSHATSLRSSCPSMFLWNQLPGSELYAQTAAGTHHRAVSILAQPRFVVDEFLTSAGEVPKTLRAFISRQVESPTYLQFPLSAQMFELASKLIDHSFAGALALVYVEAVATELLCETVKCLGKEETHPNIDYTPRDVRCLQTARDLLMRQFTPRPTIGQVARSVGLNETTLKSGFKAMFGETIFDFSLRCRMQRALTLLRDERWPVYRVGEAVGYSHQTSFATAFRRHFDMCPKEVRQRRRS